MLHTYELAYQTATILVWHMIALIILFNDDYDHEVMTMRPAGGSSPVPACALKPQLPWQCEHVIDKIKSHFVAAHFRKLGRLKTLSNHGVEREQYTHTIGISANHLEEQDWHYDLKSKFIALKSQGGISSWRKQWTWWWNVLVVVVDFNCPGK